MDATGPNPFDEVVSLRRRGHLAEAEIACDRILAERPDDPHVLHLRGLLAFERRDLALARQLFERAIQLNPHVADFFNSLGAVLAECNAKEASIAAFKKAVRLRNSFPKAWQNLAVTLTQSGQLAEALAAWNSAIEYAPGSASMVYERAKLYGRLERWPEAVNEFQAALRLRPNDVGALSDLAHALMKARQFEVAGTCYRRLISTAPKLEHYNSLAYCLREAGKLPEAVVVHQDALRISSDDAISHHNFGATLWRLGRLSETIDSYRKALAARPNFSKAHSDLIYALYHDPAATPATLLEEAKRWSENHARLAARNIFANSLDPARRLRVGYLSPDFRSHTIPRVILPILEHHDRCQFEIFCYSAVENPDNTTSKIRSLADQWREVQRMAPGLLASQIKRDQIDILVDLAGHWGGNRLLALAMKPAPVQIQLAFPGTTGLAAIDYRITDFLSDPPGLTERYYTEKLLRLTCGWPYKPDNEGPWVASPPSISAGYVTFGCLNRPIKVSATALTLWCQILKQVTDSKLLLLAGPGDSDAYFFRDRFVGAGGDLSRFEICPRLPRSKYLELHSRVDIMLDTFPYNGDTTTCDSLWMGVPVVTLAGDHCHSRRGVSHLTHVGLTDLIANTPDEYVNVAANLAEDRSRLSNLRRELRSRLLGSAIVNGARYTKELEEAYRTAWRRWCEKSISD